MHKSPYPFYRVFTATLLQNYLLSAEQCPSSSHVLVNPHGGNGRAELLLSGVGQAAPFAKSRCNHEPNIPVNREYQSCTWKGLISDH